MNDKNSFKNVLTSNSLPEGYSAWYSSYSYSHETDKAVCFVRPVTYKLGRESVTRWIPKKVMAIVKNKSDNFVAIKNWFYFSEKLYSDNA